MTTFSTSLFLLVLALVRGNDEGWGSPLIVSLLASAVVLLITFVVIERRVAQPMLPLELFKRPAFTGVQLAAFAVSGSMFALFLYLTLYLQNFLGYSPIDAGLLNISPFTVASFIVAPMAGLALARIHARYLMAGGLALTGVGLALMAGLHLDSTWTALLAGFVVKRSRRGAAEPGDRRRRAQRRPEGAKRHGRRDQRHVPPGRHRRRHRRLGSDLPGRRSVEDAGGRRRR